MLFVKCGQAKQEEKTSMQRPKSRLRRLRVGMHVIDYFPLILVFNEDLPLLADKIINVNFIV